MFCTTQMMLEVTAKPSIFIKHRRSLFALTQDTRKMLHKIMICRIFSFVSCGLQIIHRFIFHPWSMERWYFCADKYIDPILHNYYAFPFHKKRTQPCKKSKATCLLWHMTQKEILHKTMICWIFFLRLVRLQIFYISDYKKYASFLPKQGGLFSAQDHKNSFIFSNSIFILKRKPTWHKKHEEDIHILQSVLSQPFVCLIPSPSERCFSECLCLFFPTWYNIENSRILSEHEEPPWIWKTWHFDCMILIFFHLPFSHPVLALQLKSHRSINSILTNFQLIWN